MKNYKRFNVVNQNDYLIYLRQIIVVLNKHFTRMEKYIFEMEDLINKLKLKDKDKSVKSDIYEEYRDKTQFLENKILNLLGDMQSDSISYNKFKRKLVKNNIEVKKLIGNIPEELAKLLNEMNNSRNWGLHEPESLLNAHLENIKGFWPEHELQWYLNNFNPIIIASFENYEGRWLISLHEACKTNLGLYREIYDYILNDYKILSQTEEIEIIYKDVLVRPFELEMKLPETSMQMQKNQYKNK